MRGPFNAGGADPRGVGGEYLERVQALAPQIEACADQIERERRLPSALLAWGPASEARAIAVDGGYRVTGTWNFASGGRHATWLGGYCPIGAPDGTLRRGEDGTPVGRTMLFPATSATMLDVWHVIGLKGTGSDSFSVSDLFVPDEHSVARDDPSERRHSGPLYCFTTGSLFAAGFAGVAL